jgi:hypothetical protein
VINIHQMATDAISKKLDEEFLSSDNLVRFGLKARRRGHTLLLQIVIGHEMLLRQRATSFSIRARDIPVRPGELDEVSPPDYALEVTIESQTDQTIAYSLAVEDPVGFEQVPLRAILNKKPGKEGPSMSDFESTVKPLTRNAKDQGQRTVIGRMFDGMLAVLQITILPAHDV